MRLLPQGTRAAWPPSGAGRALLALIVIGVLLRVLASISLWPTTILEDGYQNFAAANPFLDPQHPAGYALILGAIAAVTHQIAVPIVLQHLSGIASALLLGAATRRITGSAWAGLLPAAIVLLDPDEVFLEHSIMSESWQLLATSVGLYATVRSIDQPEPWRRWPLLAGAALALAVTIRSAALLMIPVAIFGLALGRPRESPRWRAPVAVAGAAAIVLLAFAGANAAFGDGPRLEPSPGWYLYGRVAQFSDCHRFTPPPGTSSLCETTPASQRRSGYYYMFLPQSPAQRLFGGFGRDDGVIGGWARRALVAQFGDFLTTAWVYFRSYYVPSSRPARLKSSTELDPQLDFTNRGNVFYAAAAQQALEDFYGPFKLHRSSWALSIIRRWQVVVRFGATALFVTTLLTLLGLLIGTRRSRVGTLVLGVGGLSLLIAPALTGTYSGRYTVAMAGPLIGGAAVALTEVLRARRRVPRSPAQG
ncbi:MAG: glycosyltransferase family 39 protein [Actinomycetota bacterium]|nr:glycosyltransferase family 39 protein [Actinomycetota bacterium]